MEVLDKILQSFPNYSPQASEEIKPYLTKKNLKKGEYFLGEGQICRQIGFIEKGLFRLFYLNDGKEITNCFCKENTVTCSYRSLITQTPSEVAIQAIEDSELVVFSNDSLQKLYAKSAFWQQAGRMVSEQEYIAMDCHNRFLQDLTATERYLQFLESDSKLFNRIPLNYLASYLQIAPETLSRIRRKISRT